MTTYKAYRRSTNPGFQTLISVTETIPPLKPTEVLLRIHAVSLNYRDVAMMDGKYPIEVIPHGIPASDCAAEVIEIGPEVNQFKIGDHVAPIFDLNNLTATEDETRTLGGDVDGVLRQCAVFEQDVLLPLPGYLSWEEAACITCAGTTAWKALDMPRSSGTALLQGTGGVSIFALILSLASGIHPIITSSSDNKLSHALSIGPPGAISTINYTTHPNWDEEVHRLTNRGVDIVIENVGVTTISRSLSSLARRGLVSLVGFLGGFEAAQVPNLMGPTLGKSATIRGISVGSKIDQKNLCDFLSEREVSLKPLLDKRVFSFEESQDAFDYLYAAKHTGKVIIRM
ncbi:uncharacterized protein N7443_009312 [Penicillium atrosanguineum]|uniref:Enoyl reductase (ER) domain-containing protein n=1 Tax=Penicillium atrosanguineum TaxID=1132637 RepID=A0A9W9TZT5_9EURO|nr:uncharacterized protein N7443_009312 [Penicillium atrosanguineum]KAJ5126268.1 hypothetical protein N7526_008445 [Penicillium atrosanguineum]KAJ5293359.1 hypothetical protein N7443_009312 [Penicillium atrosanguineum]KAJ5302607.1 hypothetical protein N7476_009406 [Penicillium atrosanguineum]